MRKFCKLPRLTLAAVLLLGMSWTVGAEDSEAQVNPLDIAVEFRPITEEDLATHKAALEASLRTLDQFLINQGGDARTTWRKDLALDDLEDALAAEKASLPALRATLAKFATSAEGLEANPFLDARSALARYDRALLIHGNPKSKELFDQQIQTLRGQLKALDTNPTLRTRLAVGATLGNLELAGQAKELVSATRAKLRRPNLTAIVSERLASAGMQRPIDETQGVNEVILGTTNRGTAHTTGSTAVRFLPSSEGAQLEILMKGVANSNTVGVNRGVTIRSQGQTQLSAGASVLLNELGLSGDPAWANATTSTTVTSIWHKCQAIRRIAKQRVAESKGKAEQIAAQRAANRLAGRLNLEREETVNRLNGEFRNKFRYPLLRKGQFPSLLAAATTENVMTLMMTQASPYQLAAASDPPELETGLDLAVRVHESFAGNMSEAMIGGETLTSENLLKQLKEATGKIPEGLADEDEPPWSITFSRSQPIQVEFGDQQIRLQIKGRRFTRGDTAVNSEMVIAATYKIERTENGTRLLRDGEVTAEYTDGKFQNAEKIAIKTVMRKKFTALLKEERTFDGLQLPGEWESTGKLPLKQMVCGNRWLALGWTLPKETAQNDSQAADVAAVPQSPDDGAE